MNFYREKDKNDFYGREEDIERLSLYIINNAQTVLFGKSGIGKSSILNAGVFPVAREHGLFPVPVKLIHNGGKTYLQQIREKVAGVVERQGASMHELAKAIDEKKETLWEYLHRIIIYDADGRRVRLLLVIDQFEEIFTLQQDENIREEFFAELADLLNDVMPLYIAEAQNSRGNGVVRHYAERKDSEIEIDLDLGAPGKEMKYLERSEFHVVLTLRDDFLGCLERYTANIPCMKTNRYALQPLSRSQAERIITLPRKDLMAAGVADLIIRKVTDKADNRLNGLSEASVDAAMLSLYLSRLYTKRKTDEEQITVELVRQFSDNIIRDFYEDAVRDIPAGTVEKLEDELLTVDDRRNNVSVRDLVNRGIPEGVIRSLVDDKKLLRQFNYGGDIRVEYMHDVLCKVVSERIEQRELRKAQERARRLKRKNRRMWIGMAAATLLVAIAAFTLWDGLYHDVEVHYGIVVKRYGWFEGLERISQDEASYRNCHYVLKYHGRWARHPYAMEARDGYGNFTTEHTWAPYIINQFDDTDTGVNEKTKERIGTICQWEFVSSRDGDCVIQERALDKDGNLVFVYNRSVTHDPAKVISTYSDDYGFPLMLRDSTYYYIRTTYDERGFETLMEFYNDQGMPITNKENVYQTRRCYLDNGVKSAEFSCFLDGRRMIDRFGNCGYICQGFTADSLRWTEAVYVDADLDPCRSTAEQVIAQKVEYDEHGRDIQISYWNQSDEPDTCVYGFHAVCYEYNRHGKVTRQYFLDSDSVPCTLSSGLKEVVWDYDEWGNKIREEKVYRTMTEGEIFEYLKDGTRVKYESYVVYADAAAQDTVFLLRSYDDTRNRTRVKMYQEHCERSSYDERGNLTCVAWFDAANRRPVEIDGYHVHRTAYDYQGKKTHYSTKYYGLNGSVVKPLNDYAHSEFRVDSLERSVSVLRYDEHGNFLRGDEYTYGDESFRYELTQQCIDEDWLPFRLFRDNDIFFRKRFVYSVRPEKSREQYVCYGESEFGGPALIVENGLVYYAAYHSHGLVLYDENGAVVGQYDENRHLVRQSDREWPYLAYIDTKNHKRVSGIGFNRGDIILECNDWSMNFSSVDPFYRTPFWDSVERNFTVARLDKERHLYDTVRVVVPGSVDLNHYVGVYKQRATAAEAVEFQAAIINGRIRKDMLLATPSAARRAAGKSGVRGDVFILECDGWNFLNDSVTTMPNLNGKERDGQKRIVCIDCETHEIVVLDATADMPGWHTRDVKISPAYYNRVVNLYKEWKSLGKAKE